MTRSNENIVSLSVGNWAGVIVTIVTALAGQWFLLQGRISALEIEQARSRVAGDNQERRLTGLETKSDQWLQSISDLRHDLGLRATK